MKPCLEKACGGAKATWHWAVFRPTAKRFMSPAWKAQRKFTRYPPPMEKLCKPLPTQKFWARFTVRPSAPRFRPTAMSSRFPFSTALITKAWEFWARGKSRRKNFCGRRAWKATIALWFFRPTGKLWPPMTATARMLIPTAMISCRAKWARSFSTRKPEISCPKPNSISKTKFRLWLFRPTEKPLPSAFRTRRHNCGTKPPGQSNGFGRAKIILKTARRADTRVG